MRIKISFWNQATMSGNKHAFERSNINSDRVNVTLFSSSFSLSLSLSFCLFFVFLFFFLQPLFVRLDTLTHFQFRIRNLPYDYDNYILEIDDATQEIVLKTKNKKYYKRMAIPDLKTGGAAGKLDNKYLNYKHANNTLIISVRQQ